MMLFFFQEMSKDPFFSGFHFIDTVQFSRNLLNEMNVKHLNQSATKNTISGLILTESLLNF